jgi:hypothetical protein
VDGDLRIDTPVSLPPIVWPGFTAGTGTKTDQHAVRNVAVTTPSVVRAVLRTDTTRPGTAAASSPRRRFGIATPGETLVALVGYDGPGTGGGQTATVTGAGLTWRLVKRANGQPGTSKVWTAAAPGRLSSDTVTATPASTYDGSLTVLSLQGSQGAGAAAAVSGATGAAGVTVTTTAPGSRVFGAGNDWDGAVARTLPAEWSMVHQWVDSGAGGHVLEPVVDPEPGRRQHRGGRRHRADEPPVEPRCCRGRPGRHSRMPRWRPGGRRSWQSWLGWTRLGS